MVVFMISSPLALSCILRNLVEHNTISLMTDNLLIVLSLQYVPRFWVTFCISVLIFLALSFYETRAEYMNYEGNVREQMDHSSSTSASTTSPISEMCPMKSLGLLNFNKTNPHLPNTDIEKRRIAVEGLWKESTNLDDLQGDPILFPCELRHRRIAPFKDRFQHSYLYVGIPVGLHATYSPILSIDQPEGVRSNWPFREAWFNIRAQDHAIRGGAHMTMSQKLKEYLLSIGAHLNEWAYAYMIAVPNVNGQVDNPLGFWYLYTSEKKLTAIVPELNTSYGERRMWLVRQSLPQKSDSTPSKASLYSFRGNFGKDIHVSPFMPPSGGYTIDTCDPCASSGRLEILVTLTKPDGGPLLITRVSSTAPGLNASTASLREKLAFLARWCYIPTTTVMTYRILTQAARIYLKAPRVWKRPEPIKTALGKPARVVEMILERTFRLILKEAVENYPSPISVVYNTPGEHTHQKESFSSFATFKNNNEEPIQTDGTITPPPSHSSDSEIRPVIDLHVISPMFYSRFFHYRTPCEAITNELLDDVRTRTLSSSDAELFASVFDHINTARTTLYDAVTYPSTTHRRHWKLIELLRTAPIATNFPRSIQYQPFTGLSFMDKWILKNGSPEDIENHRRALLRVYAGEWIGGTIWPLKLFSDDMEPFGLSRDAVLRIYDAIFRASMAAATAEVVKSLNARCDNSLVGIAGWVAAGINLWACLKASL